MTLTSTPGPPGLPPPPPFSPLLFRDAAALACTCTTAAAAYPESRWPRAVRIGRSGAVCEPASGTFDVSIDPSREAGALQAAVDGCPPGGCVLLLPGLHTGPLELAVDKKVHVFGQGRATMKTAAGSVIVSKAASSTIDGVNIQREASPAYSDVGAVAIQSGGLRLQACDVRGVAFHITCITMSGGADAVVNGCRSERSSLNLTL